MSTALLNKKVKNTARAAGCQNSLGNAQERKALSVMLFVKQYNPLRKGDNEICFFDKLKTRRTRWKQQKVSSKDFKKILVS